MPESEPTILTQRFVLRPLCPDDVTPRYNSWLDDPSVRQTILAAVKPHGPEELRAYIQQRQGRPDVLFLGIFNRITGEHIGNIKYEPVDVKHGYAIMGILIGDPASRGQNAAPEVIDASAHWLHEHRGIREIILGVKVDNPSAIRAYEKAGFKTGNSPWFKPGPEGACMIRRLP